MNKKTLSTQIRDFLLIYASPVAACKPSSTTILCCFCLQAAPAAQHLSLDSASATPTRHKPGSEISGRLRSGGGRWDSLAAVTVTVLLSAAIPREATQPVLRCPITTKSWGGPTGHGVHRLPAPQVLLPDPKLLEWVLVTVQMETMGHSPRPRSSWLRRATSAQFWHSHPYPAATTPPPSVAQGSQPRG